MNPVLSEDLIEGFLAKSPMNEQSFDQCVSYMGDLVRNPFYRYTISRISENAIGVYHDAMVSAVVAGDIQAAQRQQALMEMVNKFYKSMMGFEGFYKDLLDRDEKEIGKRRRSFLNGRRIIPE